ncbi:hypothetical protein BCR43DRAFT_482706 [Syncephalastrum racemosum]|uniref:Uncharacterized protein n=1 Tax=Syncephalastrum racemosum TaxID=13706 RepID=A0A1X2HU84_SYNRA|nr:hypothetical protein BCR43DRAFT_482706 [Syncephalastrum racemosum]
MSRRKSQSADSDMSEEEDIVMDETERYEDEGDMERFMYLAEMRGKTSMRGERGGLERTGIFRNYPDILDEKAEPISPAASQPDKIVHVKEFFNDFEDLFDEDTM